MAGKPRILIVEDDPFMADIMVRKFGDGGFEVIHAPNGEEALKRAAEQMPDIISLDVMLPGIDGYEVLRRLKADNDLAKIPVIVCSNIGNDEDIQKAKELGALDYFVKISVDFTDLIATFRRACSK